MKKLLTSLVIVLVFGSFQSVAAEDCVQLDIELPDTVMADAGTMATGYFELISCGDEDAVIELDIDIQFGDYPIEIKNIPVRMGSGEVIAREFAFLAPTAMAGYTVTFCITATSGTAVASDCAGATFVDGGELAADSDQKQFGFAMTTGSECVGVDLELPDTLFARPASFAAGYFELTNCGEEAAVVDLDVRVEFLDT